MFGLTTVVLDSRLDVFDRISVGASNRVFGLDNSNSKLATGLGEAVSLLERNPVTTLFVHALDCDETKLIEALRCIPGKLPGKIVVYGAYASTTSKFVYALESQFGSVIDVEEHMGDL